jgi:VIT1/CCC1 family predicted Fe2+/Mn2+ transporter
MKKELSTQTFALYFRNFIFGVEDSLVSTVGLLSGIAIADVPRATIFLSGMVLIFVEAFSMGVGSFLSETSGDEVVHKKEQTGHPTIRAGVIMFFSYFLAGFIPLAPYVFAEVKNAFPISVIMSLVTLFILGLISAKFSTRAYWKTGLRMFLIGGLAIGLGILVGSIVHGIDVLM